MPRLKSVGDGYTWFVTMVAYALMAAAGASILAIIALVCAEVVLRRFGMPIVGTLDLVKILGTITIACALPYTTAVKGHVAIEYFFLKLSRRGRVVVDTVARLIGITLFTLLAIESVRYGNAMKQSGQVSQTVQLPLFWVPYVIAVSCAEVALITIHHLLHPGKEMIKSSWPRGCRGSRFRVGSSSGSSSFST